MAAKMMARSKLGTFLTLLIGLQLSAAAALCMAQGQGSAQVQGVEKSPEIEIATLVATALSNHPILRKQNHQIESIKAELDQAMALPDPQLKATAYGAPVETAAGRQRVALAFSQKYITRSRREAKQNVIRARLAAQCSVLDGLKVTLAAQVRQAAVEIAFLQKAIQITTEDQSGLKSLEKIILEAYKVQKKVSQRDVLNIQIELSEIESKLAGLKEQMGKSKAVLFSLLGNENLNSSNGQLSPDANGSQAINLPSIRWPENWSGFSFNQNEMIGKAVSLHPDLLQKQLDAQAKFRQIQLAKLQLKPDYNLGLQWIGTEARGLSPVANGDDALMLSVGFNLPVNKSRIRAAQRQAEQASLAAIEETQSVRLNVEKKVRVLFQQLKRLDQNLGLYKKQILPKAEQSFRLATSQYRHGDLNYDQLIKDWRMVLRYRLKTFELESQRYKTMVQLWEASGQVAPESNNNLAPAS